MNLFLEIFTNANFYHSVLAVTPPILLAALGCAIAAKADMTNMGMEGIMAISSLAGVMASVKLGENHPWVELIVAMVVGGLLGLAVATFNLKLKVDIILVGIAMNLIGTGGTAFFLYLFTGDRSTSNSYVSGTLPEIQIPLIKDIPFIGTVLSGQNILTYISYILILVLSFLLFKTKLGLRIRAVGENPNACESVGISSTKIRTIALVISGVLGGMGGAFMSSVYLSYFQRGCAAGRGFIALAACSLGEANPGPVALTSLLFGLFYALSNFARSTGISSYLLNTWPYVVTIISLVIYSIQRERKEKKRLAGLAELEDAKAPKEKEQGRQYFDTK